MQQGFPNRPLPDGISLHILGDEAVLFDRVGQKVYAANTTAAVIWCCIEEDMAPAEIADFLAARMDIAPATASRYVRDFRLWASQTMEDRSGAIARDSLAAAMPIRRAPPRTERAAPAVVKQYRLLDSAILIRFESQKLARRADRLLGHLAEEDTQRPGTIFDVVASGEGAALLEGGQVLESCRSFDQVAPMIKSYIVLRALEECTDLCAVHAGAVRRGESCILLPGESGAGKSTLVAGLASEGFELLSDDTVVLTRDPVAVRPLTCGICVKSGAWDALAIRFPRLRRRLVESRPDGQSVRYILPSDCTIAAPDTRAPVKCIVFPRYSPDEPTAMNPIGKGAALRRLMDCFVPLRGRLDDTDVRRLVEWISDVPCYDLRVSSLNDAVWLLGQLDP